MNLRFKVTISFKTVSLLINSPKGTLIYIYTFKTFLAVVCVRDWWYLVHLPIYVYSRFLFYSLFIKDALNWSKMTVKTCYKGFLFQINAGILIFLFICESWKINIWWFPPKYCAARLFTNNNNQTCFLRAANQHIKNIPSKLLNSIYELKVFLGLQYHIRS